VSEPRAIEQAYRFALAPTTEQEGFLDACAGASRFWFNQGLALVKRRLDERAAGRDVDVPWSYKSLCTAFRGKALKDELAPWRSEVVTGSYQAGLEALGKALQNFSEGRRAGRRVGFPRFRRKGRCNESVIFQRPRLLDSRHVCLDERRLGPIHTKESLRKLCRLLERDPRARVMRATVRHENGGWFISFTVTRSAKERRARRPNAVVGVDVGLARLVTTSTAHAAANARPAAERAADVAPPAAPARPPTPRQQPRQLPARRPSKARHRYVGEVAAHAPDRGPHRESACASRESAPPAGS
jgi:putative transposase